MHGNARLSPFQRELYDEQKRMLVPGLDESDDEPDEQQNCGYGEILAPVLVVPFGQFHDVPFVICGGRRAVAIQPAFLVLFRPALCYGKILTKS